MLQSRLLTPRLLSHRLALLCRRSVRRALLVLASVAVLSGIAAPGDAHAQATPEAEAGRVVETTEHYAFRSDPWMSLHHFLYQWACVEGRQRRCASRVDVTEKADTTNLTPAERSAWNEALAAYRAVQRRSLLFDDALVEAKEVLQRRDPSTTPSTASMPLGLGDALRQAMPVYRAHWWDAHAAGNRTWIETVAAEMRPIEAEAIVQMERVYGGSWPDVRVPVDVMPYANWSSAYTTTRPVHVSLSHRSIVGRGRSVEILLHEPAHGNFFYQPLRRSLQDAFAAVDAEPPRRLWHSVIFVVAGELTRRTTARDLDGFAPQWTQISAFQSPERSAEFDALTRSIRAYLDGVVDREEAFAQVARSLASRSDRTPDAPSGSGNRE